MIRIIPAKIAVSCGYSYMPDRVSPNSQCHQTLISTLAYIVLPSKAARATVASTLILIVRFLFSCIILPCHVRPCPNRHHAPVHSDVLPCDVRRVLAGEEHRGLPDLTHLAGSLRPGRPLHAHTDHITLLTLTIYTSCTKDVSLPVAACSINSAGGWLCIRAHLHWDVALRV